jgi:O-antigen ligase
MSVHPQTGRSLPGVSPSRQARQAYARTPLFWGLCGAAAAVGLGAATADDTRLAFLLLLFAGLATAVAIRPASVLMVLIVTVLIETLTVGGLTMSRLMAPVALIVTAIGITRGSSLRISPPLCWVAAFGLWALASSFWSVDFDTTALTLGALAISVVFMLAFAVLIDNAKDLKRSIGALAVGGFIVGCFALLSFIQTGEQSDPANGDPTAFATYQIIAIPPILALASVARLRAARIALYSVVGMLIGSVGASVSRGGAVTLFAVALLLLLVPAPSIFRSRKHKLVVLGCILVSGAIVFSVTSAALVPRLGTIFGEEADGGSGRIGTWKAAQTSIEERPVLGLGLGGFGVSSTDLLRRTPGVDLNETFLRDEGLAAHNAFIGTFADLGIIGLLLFVGLLVSVARLLRRTAHRAREAENDFVRRIANALLIALAAWSVACMFISGELSRPLWVLIGLALALPKLVGTTGVSHVPRVPVLSPNGHHDLSTNGGAPSTAGEHPGRR